MKKIPTVFQRDESRRYVTDQVTLGCEWVLAGEGVATRKYDGTCVLIRRDGLALHVFARREVKPGKHPPAGFVEADYDPTTGKTVGWEPYEQSGFRKQVEEALHFTESAWLPGTYELIGPRVNGNPEGREEHVLIRHADAERVVLGPPPHTPGVLRGLIRATPPDWEGIVWHHPDGRMAKLKRRDFPEGRS